MRRQKIISAVFVFIAAVLVVSNFTLIYKVSASEQNRASSRVEYRAFRENLAILIAQNEIKHSELTTELKKLKIELASDTARVRRLETALPYEAMADRAR